MKIGLIELTKTEAPPPPKKGRRNKERMRENKKEKKSHKVGRHEPAEGAAGAEKRHRLERL